MAFENNFWLKHCFTVQITVFCGTLRSTLKDAYMCFYDKTKRMLTKRKVLKLII